MTIVLKLPVLFLATLAGSLQNADAFAPPAVSSVVASRDGLLSQTSASTSVVHGRMSDTDDELGPESQQRQTETQPQNSRRSFLSTTAATAATASIFPLRTSASTTSASSSKLRNLSDDELRKIIYSDIAEKSFLVTADITREVYDESATFTDEIDVYTMDKWIKGTKSLFVASGSRVSLVGDVDVTPTEVTFRFDEDLMFNIPFKPVCALTGKVVLTRDENSGLITSYQEFWDQSVNEVLKSAKFGKKV